MSYGYYGYTAITAFTAITASTAISVKTLLIFSKYVFIHAASPSANSVYRQSFTGKCLKCNCVAYLANPFGDEWRSSLRNL